MESLSLTPLSKFMAFASLPAQVWRWPPGQETSTPQRLSPPPHPPQPATTGWAEPPHRTLSPGWPAAMAWFLEKTAEASWDSLAPLQRKNEGVRRSKLRMGLLFWWCPTRSWPRAITSPAPPFLPKREKPTGMEGDVSSYSCDLSGSVFKKE